MDVLRDGGINWDHYLSFKDLGNGKAEVKALDRYHRFEDTIPASWTVVGEVRCFCDAEGRSGVDIKKYSVDKVIVHYPKTHIMLRDGRIFELV
jgi:hypothetical protein